MLARRKITPDQYFVACYIGGEYSEDGPHPTIIDAIERGRKNYPVFEITRLNGQKRDVVYSYVNGYSDEKFYMRTMTKKIII